MTDDIPGFRIQRALTPGEFQAALERITAAASARDVLSAAVYGVLHPLLADDGKTFADIFTHGRIDASGYAIPHSQVQAIVSAAEQRIMQWGNSERTSLLLIAAMPRAYDDPTVTPPSLPQRDWRPPVHELHITREACDVIAACTAHVHALQDHYGGDGLARTAADTWYTALPFLFRMDLGSDTRIAAAGDLSLTVATGGGMRYTVAFEPTPRVCTDPGCHAVIEDDSTAPHATDSIRGVLEHEHTPIYPLDSPQPGVWSLRPDRSPTTPN